MASFQPVKALKGKVFLRNQRFSLQNALVVLQFVIAIAMIVGTLLTTRQLRYMIDMDPGFNTDQVMLLPAYREIIEKYEPFKNALSQQTAIKGITASGQRLGGNIHQMGIRFKVDTATQNLAISHVNVDYDFIDFYGIELKEGRSFSKEFSTDAQHGFIINERLAKKMGVANPVGMPMKFGWQEEWGKVIGLAKDFNYNSLHHDINPLAMSVQPDWGFSEVSIRVDPKELQSALPRIKAQWETTGTDHPFDYEFLDTHFAELYRTDQQVSQVVAIIAGLAILIACMGLFGLVSVSAEKRTKEIGIRKVLGASIPDVLFMLSKGVAAMVLIAFAISVPLTWWFMDDWLSSFAYRVPVGAGVFIAAGALTLWVALSTISYLAYKAAKRNPIEALRYE
jgi:putative ABC transport system permease protein